MARVLYLQQEGKMLENNISFTSSYRFPMTQPGVNRAKRELLKPELEKCAHKITSFQIPNTGAGNGRISVKEVYDGFVEGMLKRLGFKRYQKLPLHDASIEDVDAAVRNLSKTNDYQQKGMQKKAVKNKRR